MKSELGDRAILQHIAYAIKEIENYIANSSYQDFQSNSMMQFATVKQLEIIGEASTQLTEHQVVQGDRQFDPTFLLPGIPAYRGKIFRFVPVRTN